MSFDELTPRSTSLSGGGGGGGGGGATFPAYDWASLATTSFALADHPDLATADGGAAVTDRATFGGGIGLRFSDATGLTLKGVKLGDAPVGDFIALIRGRGHIPNVDIAAAASGECYLSFWDGTDSATDTGYHVGTGRRSSTYGGGVGHGTGAGRNISATRASASPRMGSIFDAALVRVGTTLSAYAGNPASPLVLVEKWTVSAGAGLLAATCYGSGGPTKTQFEVVAWAAPGDVSTFPPFADDP